MVFFPPSSEIGKDIYLGIIYWHRLEEYYKDRWTLEEGYILLKLVSKRN